MRMNDNALEYINELKEEIEEYINIIGEEMTRIILRENCYES